MKKLLLILLLTSCSFNTNNTYWNEKFNSNYEKLKYDKDYTLKEYEIILDIYNDKTEIPSLN